MFNNVEKERIVGCSVIFVIIFDLLGTTTATLLSRTLSNDDRRASSLNVSPLVGHLSRGLKTLHSDESSATRSTSSTLSSHKSRHLQTFEDLSCNVFLDDCPTGSDQVCDRPNCAYDCIDCDECSQFDADCQQCANHNCHWCPGDATCWNSNQYILRSRVASCDDPSDFLQGQDNTCRSQQQFFNDPLYQAQSWVYTMIRLEDVWKMGYTGQGVRVRIHDSGLDTTHSEFQGRFDITTSCQDYAWSSSSSFSGGDAGHGTNVAGILAGAADNGHCSVGVSPGVTLSSCNVFSETDPYEYLLSFDYDIANQSFGDIPCYPAAIRQLQQVDTTTTCPFLIRDDRIVHPCDVCETFLSPTPECQSTIIQHCQIFWKEDNEACLDLLYLLVQDGQCRYNSLPLPVQNGLQQAITEGRDGKGIIFVTAIGNSYDTGGYATTLGFAQSRFTILVGAVDKLWGKHTSYTLPGPCMFISAPGGDGTNIANHVTASVNDQCEDAGMGTSFACPVVSGVVALLLEARPDLTWRDVQGILAISSQRVDDTDDTTSVINAAGYWHSDFYGFGIVDALAAMESALDWTLRPEEVMLLAASGWIGAALVDDASTTTTSTVTLEDPFPSDNAVFFTESVQVLVQLEYIARGHLEIVLVSPTGIRSMLHPGRRPEYTQEEPGTNWILLTVKTWGEDPIGNWTLELTDLTPGDAPQETLCIDAAWSIDESDLTPLTCQGLELVGACGNGVLNPDGLVDQVEMDYLITLQDDGILATEACCACGGGGVTRSDVVDQLHQWSIVVYGHWTGEDGNIRPSSEQPTALPTRLPTTRPSGAPTIRPGEVAIEPSLAQQSEIQNASQTDTPTDTPAMEDGFVVPSSHASVGPGATDRQGFILVSVVLFAISIVMSH